MKLKAIKSMNVAEVGSEIRRRLPELTMIEGEFTTTSMRLLLAALRERDGVA